MSDFKERVIEEEMDLRNKIIKLNYFIAGDTYETLERIDRELLTQQLRVMQEYQSILQQRIQRF